MKLDHLDDMENLINDKFIEFVDAFCALKVMIDGCFGYILDENYKQNIKTFEEKLMLLREHFELSITNKAHIVFEHFIPVIEKKKQGLGEW